MKILIPQNSRVGDCPFCLNEQLEITFNDKNVYRKAKMPMTAKSS
jgi:hypothetical protein